MLSEIKIRIPLFKSDYDWRSQCPFCKQISMFKAITSSGGDISAEIRINCSHLHAIIKSEDNKLENTVIQYAKIKEIAYE